MTEVSAQSATSSVDCKIALCTELAVSRFGPGAGLCHRHRGEVKQGLIAVPDAPPRIAAARHAPPGAGFAARAQSLVSVGRTLDRAVAKYKPAKSELESAMRAWRSAIADLTRSQGGVDE